METSTTVPEDGAARAPSAASGAPVADGGLRESERVGRYHVMRRLGGGGMGDVYAAYDESLDRRVALKVLRSRIVPEDWLRREALALAKLAHPNVVQVHEIGRHHGRGFVAMELVDGVTLRGWLLESARPTEEVLRMFIQCGRGLQAAHDAGLVHRDFKPDNVLVGRDGRARVLDFGLVVSIDEGEPDAVAGTPGFMSPEQLAGERVTPKSDQFSFCVALYRALYRVTPFEGDDLASLRHHVLHGVARPPPPSPSPSWIAPIVMRGLAREVSGRHGSMGELLDAIESHLPRDRDLDPSVTRRGRRVLAGAMLAMGAIIVTYFGLRGGMDGARDTGQLLYVALFTLASSTALIALLRRRLLQNRFGKRVAAVVGVATLTLVVHRVLGIHYGESFPEILAGDMLLLGVELLLAGILLQGWLAVGAAIMFAGTVVTVVFPGAALPAMAATSALSFAAALLAWTREE